MHSLKNQVALVTGAGRGIGKACALALSAEGCRVVLVSRTRTELDEVAARISEAKGESFVYAADISNEAEVEKLFSAVRSHWGSVDILVNNAAVFHRAELGSHGAKEWDFVMGVNVRGVFLCSRQVFRDCENEKKPASIVNISSLAGVRGTEKFPGLSSYVASKFAVVGLTECFDNVGRRLVIGVNCVARGELYT